MSCGFLLLSPVCAAEPELVSEVESGHQVETDFNDDSDNLCQLHGKSVWEGQHLFRELSEAMPMYVGIVSAGFHIARPSIERTGPKPECMDATSEDSCWLGLEIQSSPQNWSLSLAENQSFSFQSQFECANERFSGPGEAMWEWTTLSDWRTVIGKGRWRNGKQHGLWRYQVLSVPCIGLTNVRCKLSDEDADALESFRKGLSLPPGYVTTIDGRYRRGSKSGLWIVGFNKGDTAKIPYSNDLKHGTQTYTKVTHPSSQADRLADRYEIPWVEGKKHGRQVSKNTFGEFEEIPWDQGVIHGESVFGWAAGERETITWVNGKQHETSMFTWPDGSRLTTLYDEGTKIGYEVLSLLPQSGTDSISLESKYFPDYQSMLQVERTITRKLNGHKHGVEVWIRPDYRWRLFRPYFEGEAHGTITLVLEGAADSYHFFYRERSRQRSLQFHGQDVGASVLVAADGFRQEKVFTGNRQPYEYVTESSMDGNYRSHLKYEGGSPKGMSIRCWHDNIPWSNEEMQGVDVYRWTDGVLGLYSWKYVSWHGPSSATEPNGLCLETPYVRGKKSGIEIQTQSNGFKVHLPMRGRHLAGPIVVFRPDGSRREIPYESGRKHGVVYDFSASGEKTRVEEYNQGTLVAQ